MKATKPQLDKALKSPATVRMFLLHGPDEAGSHALAKRIAGAMGADAERIALSGAELKADPARLADEAAAISMFGSARTIIVSPVGEEALDALAALTGAPAAGNPVVLVAGALKPTSKLLKLALAEPNVLAFASYLPDARDFDRLVSDMGRERGLSIRPDVARRVADASGANRAIIEQELEKFAIYLGAGGGKTAELDHDVINAVGAARDEGDASALVDRVYDGDGRGADAELARLRSEGVEGIALIRAAIRRALLLARLRVRVEQGQSTSGVMASQGKSLFWKEKDAVERQLGAWPADRLARCLSRLLAAERDVKKAGSLGTLAADTELMAVARQASRRS
ncbi:MAG TPA: DNA polymerase III subunit delta [Allosphingosinicella sp.]